MTWVYSLVANAGTIAQALSYPYQFTATRLKIQEQQNLRSHEFSN